MQKIILLLILVIISFSCEKEKGYKIDVTVNGFADGKKVVLKKQINRIPTVIDSTTIKNGKFIFKGELKEPAILGIFVEGNDKDGIFPFVGVTDKITVIAQKDSLVKSKITGSKLNDELTRLRDERDISRKKIDAFLPEYQGAEKTNDTVTIKRIKNDIKVIQDELLTKDWDYVKSHPNSYLSPLIFNGIMANPKFRDSSKIVFDGFSDAIKKSDMVKPIVKYFDMIGKDKDEHNHGASEVKTAPKSK